MRGIIVGTGPSLTREAIALINQSQHKKFGCNLTYQDVRLDVFYANNKAFWDFYGDDPALKNGRFDKWTYEQEVSKRYGVNHIQGEWLPSLSKNPRRLHWGHGSGYELLGIAYHYGVREAVLIGYDLRFPAGYSGIEQRAGGDRHYFGEYVPELQHWTKYGIGDGGELNGLLDCYRTIDCADLGLRIINCSPGSALDFFETGRLEEWL